MPRPPALTVVGPTPRAALAELAEESRRLGSLRAGSSLGSRRAAVGDQLDLPEFVPFNARLALPDPSGPYHFVEVIRTPDHAWADLPDSRPGTAADDAGGAGLAGKVVRMREHDADADTYRFDYPRKGPARCTATKVRLRLRRRDGSAVVGAYCTVGIRTEIVDPPGTYRPVALDQPAGPPAAVARTDALGYVSWDTPTPTLLNGEVLPAGYKVRLYGYTLSGVAMDDTLLPDGPSPCVDLELGVCVSKVTIDVSGAPDNTDIAGAGGGGSYNNITGVAVEGSPLADYPPSATTHVPGSSRWAYVAKEIGLWESLIHHPAGVPHAYSAVSARSVQYRGGHGDRSFVNPGACGLYTPNCDEQAITISVFPTDGYVDVLPYAVGDGSGMHAPASNGCDFDGRGCSGTADNPYQYNDLIKTSLTCSYGGGAPMDFRGYVDVGGFGRPYYVPLWSGPAPAVEGCPPGSISFSFTELGCARLFFTPGTDGGAHPDCPGYFTSASSTGRRASPTSLAFRDLSGRMIATVTE